MSEIWISNNTKCWWAYENTEIITHTLLLGMENGPATLGNSVAFLWKPKYALTIQPNNHTVGHLPYRNGNLGPEKLCIQMFIVTLFMIILQTT